MNDYIRKYAETTVHSLVTIETALELLKDSPLPLLEELDIWVKIAARENLDLITLIKMRNAI